MHFYKTTCLGALALVFTLCGFKPAFSQDLSNIGRLVLLQDSERKMDESAGGKKTEKEVSTELASSWFLSSAERVRLSGLAQENFNSQQSSSASPSTAQQSLPALTTGGKFKYAFKRAFLKPTPYIFTGFSAAITELNEQDPTHKGTGDKVADGLSRYAIDFATGSTRTMFTSGIYPTLFHQEPRYRPSPKRDFKSRLFYAASRVIVAESDDGRSQPNYSRLFGDLTASALANLWERDTPDRIRIGASPTFSRFGKMVGLDFVRIIVQEFGPDIKKKLLKK